MRFCRSCYAILDDTKEICPVCGTNCADSKKNSLGRSMATATDTKPKEPKTAERPINKFVDRPYRPGQYRSIRFRFAPKGIENLSLSSQRLSAILKHPDGLALVIFATILLLKIYFAVGTLFESWDGYVYLLNARAFASNLSLPNYFEVLRPPLYPYVISRLWLIAGENITLAKIASPIFTVASAALLYLLLKHMFNTGTGLIASVGFLLSPVIMQNTDAVLVHGMGVFFVTLVVFALWRARSQPRYYLVAGFACALASLTRYPDLLIGICALVFLLIDLKERPQTRKEILTWGALGTLAFALTWLPWLWWCQSAYGDPLISLKLGLASGTVAVHGPDWLFYIKAIPDLVAPMSDEFTIGSGIGTIIAASLILIGLASRNWLKDRRRVLIALWFLVFLGYYSQVSNQASRFMVEWAPPIFAIIGIGASTSYLFLKQKIRIRRIIPAISISTIIGIWLILLLLGSVAGESIWLSQATYEGATNGLVSVPGFQQSTSWLQQHMNTTETGATDLAPFFSFYTGRFFYDWGYIEELAESAHISIRQELMSLHIKYLVLRDFFIAQNNLNLTLFVKVQGFTGYTIYATG